MLGFSGKKRVQPQKRVFYHEDHQYRELNEAIVGRKGLHLFHLRYIDVPTPDFFVISPSVYKDFMLGAFNQKLVKLLETMQKPDEREVRKLVMKADFGKDFEEELMKNYMRMSGFSSTWVAVRASVVFPSRKDVTFNAMFKVELNVRGIEHLITAIKEVYASVFTDKLVVYAQQHNVDLSEMQMAVVVQRMVQPEVSGVTFTLDPVTYDKKIMSIESVFGLGDVIFSGEITPDQYILEKKRLNIQEKHISPQEWMKIRKPIRKETSRQIEEVQRIKISRAWSHQQKLEDRNIVEVAKISLLIEDRFKAPQDVEWVWESGKIWILESKEITNNMDQKVTPATVADIALNPPFSENVFDVAVDIVNRSSDEKIQKVSKAPTPQVDSQVQSQQVIAPDQNTNDANSVSTDLPIPLAGDAAVDTNKSQVTEQTQVDAKPNQTVNVQAPATNVTPETKKSNRLISKFNIFSRRKAKKQAQVIADQSKVDEKEVKKDLVAAVTNKINNATTQTQILSGIGASFGVISGIAKKVDKNNFDKVVATRNTILVMEKYLPEFERLLLMSGGVIVDDGGLTSNVAVLAREHNVPAVVGVAMATPLIVEGDTVKIDGNTGSIYKLTGQIEGDIAKLQDENQTPPASENPVDIIKSETAAMNLGDTQTAMDEAQDTQLIRDQIIQQNEDRSESNPMFARKTNVQVDAATEVKSLPTESVGFLMGSKKASNESQDQNEVPLTNQMQEAVAAPSQSDELEQPDTIVVTQGVGSQDTVTATDIFVDYFSEDMTKADGFVYYDLDSVVLSQKRHPLAFVKDKKFKEYQSLIAKNIDGFADVFEDREVIVSIGSATVEQMRALTHGSKFENSDLADSAVGAQRLAANDELFKRQLSIIKRVRNVHKNKNVNLAIHSPNSVEALRAVKKLITVNGLKRTRNFKIYLIIESATEVVILEEILKAKVDGIILNTPSIARQLQGLSLDAENNLVNLSSNSVLKVVKNVLEICKLAELRSIVVSQRSVALIDEAISNGADAITVTPDFIDKARKKASDIEAGMILGGV